MPPAWIYPSYLGSGFLFVMASKMTVTIIKNTLPPSSAGIGSMFIIARLMAINAEKYSML